MSAEINAENMYYKELNELVRTSPETEIILHNVIGQRYIGGGANNKNIEIHGIPGNALGAYLNNCRITVCGNAQDATGDTMNSGEIVIHGNCGDACGYGMRDGKIFIKGCAGYRAAIHMKEYHEHIPLITIGGKVGDFAGEYLAGGRLIILGLGYENENPVGNYCGTGMHGGAIYIRSSIMPIGLPKQVCCSDADKDDIAAIRADIEEFCGYFGFDAEMILSSHFFKLTPNSQNPYKQLYVNN